MQFFKLLLGFAPWLAFLIIAHGSLLRLKIGLITALALSVVMGLTRLHRGVILWVGLAFFTWATVAVVGLEDEWVTRWMGVLANGALAAATGLTIVLGRPFTLEYAKDQVDPSLWEHPVFLRTNQRIASAWCLVFFLNLLLAWAKKDHMVLPDLGFELLSYALLLATVRFTTWYPKYVRARAERAD